MKKVLGLPLAFMLLLSLVLASAASADRDGPTIYKKVCKMCHKFNKKLIGPAWKGVQDRTTKEWAKKWVRNPQKMWEANEGYTKTMRENFKTGKKKKSTMGTTCPKLKKLTDKEVDTIVDWVFDVWRGEKV
ncbi:MAG: c-type cytochrome [Nitrospinota bacterium]